MVFYIFLYFGVFYYLFLYFLLFFYIYLLLFIILLIFDVINLTLYARRYYKLPAKPDPPIKLQYLHF